MEAVNASKPDPLDVSPALPARMELIVLVALAVIKGVVLAKLIVPPVSVAPCVKVMPLTKTPPLTFALPDDVLKLATFAVPLVASQYNGPPPTCQLELDVFQVAPEVPLHENVAAKLDLVTSSNRTAVSPATMRQNLERFTKKLPVVL